MNGLYLRRVVNASSFILQMLLLTLIVVFRAHGSPADAVVIIYAHFPGYAVYELGTGTFVDHDGLILTADHVVHHLTLSPPSSSILGLAPSPTTPNSITVYSAFLSSKFDVDLTQTNAVVGGQLSATQWMDVAFLRVSLSDSQRLQLQPLDLSLSAPSQGDSVDAYGPLCTNVSDLRCFQPGITKTVLNSAPALSRDYQVRDNIIPGYSGGPLVNASGNIVAIASWGDVIQPNQVVVRASYTPAPYILRYFLSRVPLSPLLSGSSACAQVHLLPYLTTVDWREISARWVSQAELLQGADQCTCCCESLDKARNAVDAPPGSSCVPPFCAERRFYALSSAISLALRTKTVADDTVTEYKNFKAAFSQINLNSTTKERRAELYAEFGSTLTEIATNEQTSANPAFANSLDEAIVAVNNSQQLRETSKNYFIMANLFRAAGDKVHAAAASVLGAVVDLPPAIVRAELHINPDALRKDVQAGVKAQSNPN